MSAESRLALLLRQTAKGELSGDELRQEINTEAWSEVDWHAPLLARVRHFIQQFADDEEIRQQNADHAAHQIKILEELATRLEQ
jgi:hypothetical protein